MKQKVVIIGAGIGGIATANILAKAGYDVAVYEKNNQLGGRAGLLQKDGFRFDTGPSWYLMPDVFEHYFSLFGQNVSAQLDLVRLNPAYKVFFERQQPITITSDIQKDAQTFASIEPGADTRLKKYVSQSRHMYRLSLDHFLYSNFTSPVDLTHPAILSRAHTMAKLAFTPIHTYVSRYFTDQRLQQIMEYPMVFLGTSPFTAPALYSLMSALDFNEGVFYPKGGIYTIIERLVALGKQLGVRFYTGESVERIVTQSGRATGVQLASGAFVPADIVVSNADMHFNETKLLDPQNQTYPEKYWNKKQPGPSALLMYLGVKGKLPQLQHHNLLFVDDWQSNFAAIYHDKSLPKPASLYICKPSASDPSVAPKGHENVFVLVPLPAGITLSKQQANSLGQEYLSQIVSMTGITDFSDRIISKTVFGPDDFSSTFNAWQSTALGPSHVLSQSAMFRTGNKSKKLNNLYYVGGSTVPGIGLPMCLISAELLYKRLAGDKRGGRITTIKPIGQQYD